MDDLTIGDHFAAFVGGSALVDPARDGDAHNASSCQTGGPRRCTLRHRCFMRRERGTACVLPVDVRGGRGGAVGEGGWGERETVGEGRRCPLLRRSRMVDGGCGFVWRSGARPQLQDGGTVVELGGGLLSGNRGAGGGDVGMLWT